MRGLDLPFGYERCIDDSLVVTVTKNSESGKVMPFLLTDAPQTDDPWAWKLLLEKMSPQKVTETNFRHVYIDLGIRDHPPNQRAVLRALEATADAGKAVDRWVQRENRRIPVYVAPEQ
ncbi:hypothetical protein KBD18_00655 [Patescibacteria group bacterium]|nr:hypothetical protein [Patescibacteria group bacterium]